LANRVGINIPHQGAFVKRSVFSKIKFDENINIFGDAVFWQLMRNSSIFIPILIDNIVARFPMDGVGSSPEYIWKRFYESKKLLLANNDYMTVFRRFVMSSIGYGIYKLFGKVFYFKFYIKIINYLVKNRG